MFKFNKTSHALRCRAMVKLGYSLGIRDPNLINEHVATMLGVGVRTSPDCALIAFGFNRAPKFGNNRFHTLETPRIDDTWNDALNLSEADFCAKWVDTSLLENQYDRTADLTIRAFSTARS